MNKSGCYIFVLILISAIFITLRIFNIISPISTWEPSIRIITSKWDSKNGDSIYLTSLQKKADIYAKKNGYHKREVKTRKKILDYYIEHSDKQSINYATAKIKYYNTLYNSYTTAISDAKDILWKAWENNQLNDEQKIILYNSILLLIREGHVKERKDALINALQVTETINSSTKRYFCRHIVLTCLIKLSMENIEEWPELQHYFDIFQPQFCSSDNIRQSYWIALSDYQLSMHNTIRAQQYLDSAKSIDVHEENNVFEITRIQADIYNANGETKSAIKERKKQISLLRKDGINILSLIYRHIIKYDNAINKHSKWKIKLYTYIIGLEINALYKQIKNLNPQQEKIIKTIRNSYYVLLPKALLILGENKNEVYNLISKIKTFDELDVDQTLQLINHSISTALLCSSDSTEVFLQKNIDELRNRIKNTFSYMTEEERFVYWSKEESILREIYAIDGCSKVKYDVALLTKGLLLNASNKVKYSILESRDSVLIDKWNHLQMLRSNTNHSKYTGKQLQSIQLLADSLEHIITNKSLKYQKYKDSWIVSWKDVQKQLCQEDCAIEFIKFPITLGDKNDNQYSALILSYTGSPICIDLFKESEIPMNHNELYNTNSTIYQKLWEPLEPYLPEGKIYVSMDGELHRINIEALPMQNGKIISEKYEIVRVSSTRELVNSTTISWDKSKTILYGGINYDLPNDEKYNNTTKTHSANKFSFKDIFKTREKKGNATYNYLEYSLLEVGNIHNLINSCGFQTCLWTNNTASKDNFKSLSGQKNSIIHIATHSILDWQNENQTNPMRHSCLLFAGANNALKNGHNNGILSAAEISTLDFRGTDLVILSACNTALGNITSDGVFGLQRSFKQAGVQTIIMTLWNIDDESTFKFMIDFYTQLLRGETKRSAFNKSLKNQKIRYPNDPVHWAGFIMLD